MSLPDTHLIAWGWQRWRTVNEVGTSLNSITPEAKKCLEKKWAMIHIHQFLMCAIITHNIDGVK